ncbi:CDCA3 protein, partial [Rhynochetos jubatus]|nr:CDCA3 protein [Rhynochetos jubatus]
QVVSSPVGSPQPGPAEPAVGTNQDRDPRSPTPGISRTPMRAVSSDSVDCLVKQLSEAFGDEAASQTPAPPGAARPTEEPAAEQQAPWSSPPAGASGEAAASREEAERPPLSSAATVRPALALPWYTDVFSLSPGSKPVRRKTNNKIMAGGGAGRSPLSILQDDNSPSTPAPRQAKRHVLSENQEMTVDLSRTLKSANCAWRDLNKENQQSPFVEN